MFSDYVFFENNPKSSHSSFLPDQRFKASSDALQVSYALLTEGTALAEYLLEHCIAWHRRIFGLDSSKDTTIYLDFMDKVEDLLGSIFDVTPKASQFYSAVDKLYSKRCKASSTRDYGKSFGHLDSCTMDREGKSGQNVGG